jgi:2-polyprenyl-6-hydroxyphenyl methylase/3-demethylubiquinone-9 3-methyltransferase
VTDHEEVKARTRAVWAMGEYEPIADMLRPAAQDLLDACAISAGQEVLDVGAGTGNLALLAAEEGASVVAADLTPEMVEKGRARTAAEGVDVEWIVADAEELPFEDARFDCAASVFGAIFAPRPEVMIEELFRVVRPGNTVGLTAWGDYGLQAEIFSVFDEFRPPSDVPAPALWGDPAVAEERLAPFANRVQTEKRTLPWNFDSWDDAWRIYSNNGPLVALRRMVGEETFDTLRERVEQIVTRWNGGSLDGPVSLPAEYLQIVARKRG